MPKAQAGGKLKLAGVVHVESEGRHIQALKRQGEQHGIAVPSDVGIEGGLADQAGA